MLETIANLIGRSSKVFFYFCFVGGSIFGMLAAVGWIMGYADNTKTILCAVPFQIGGGVGLLLELVMEVLKKK
jgi:hypothetical protein